MEKCSVGKKLSALYKHWRLKDFPTHFEKLSLFIVLFVYIYSTASTDRVISQNRPTSNVGSFFVSKLLLEVLRLLLSQKIHWVVFVIFAINKDDMKTRKALH